MLFEQLNPHACRTYLIGDDSGRVALVDPVLDHFTDYLRLLEERKLRLTAVIDTHTHADHISAGPALRDACQCEYLMHEEAPARCVTLHVHDGDVREIAGLPVSFLFTPGHTADGLCLVVGDLLLSGDTLFLDDGGAGRDDLPGGDPARHFHSLQKLRELPDHLLVHPAHEYRDRRPSTLGEQKQRNPHLAHRDVKAFTEYIEDLRLGPADWMRAVLAANYACARDPGAAWIPADLPACEVGGTREHTVNDLQPEAIGAAALRERLAADAPLLLDVRQPEELAGELGALPGVVNIPVGELAHRLGELTAWKEKDLVVICRSGSRAVTAANILAKAGFRHALVLEGGMISWRMHRY